MGDAGGGQQADRLADLAHARREAPALHGGSDHVEDQALARGQAHRAARQQVVRPGEQIDTNVNTRFRPPLPGFAAVTPTGPAVPAVLFRNTDYWAQGLNFGLQYRY